jgi:putative transcriptional regulator
MIERTEECFDLKPQYLAADTAYGLAETLNWVVNDELLYVRRMTLTELADRVGITLANLSILKTGKAKAIRFSTLDAINRSQERYPCALSSEDVSQENNKAAHSESCVNSDHAPRDPLSEGSRNE